MTMIIGVLALQGDFAKHIEILQKLGVEVIEVRTPEELDQCDGLIIPGGESTVISRQIDFIQMREKLKNFAQRKSVFGTCAGLILMSDRIESSAMKPLKLLNITVERNAFGRQVESFEAPVELLLDPARRQLFDAFFIRAPRIRSNGPEVRVLARYQDEPILVQQGIHLGATFHPELTNDVTIHKYFIDLINKKLL